MKTNAESNQSLQQGIGDASWLEVVRRQVSSLNFGMVQIVVHASRVVQIERTEKVRLEHPIAITNHGD